jgi:hypothetical protein
LTAFDPDAALAEQVAQIATALAADPDAQIDLQP